MSRADAAAWLGAAPPDLSVEARVRGRDWLYSYLLAFYRDDKSATGWNNLVFPNVGMPHVLWNLSGSQKLVETEFEDLEKAEAAAIAAKSLALVEPAAGGKFVVKTLATDTPGTLSAGEYKALVGDLVNYLDYIAEPVKNERINIGIVVLIFLGVLFALVYSLKRDYWKEVH
jgi:ubiquinol-cytochrome c reductase cytochrome c1 subunit